MNVCSLGKNLENIDEEKEKSEEILLRHLRAHPSRIEEQLLTSGSIHILHMYIVKTMSQIVPVLPQQRLRPFEDERQLLLNTLTTSLWGQPSALGLVSKYQYNTQPNVTLSSPTVHVRSRGKARGSFFFFHMEMRRFEVVFSSLKPSKGNSKKNP